MRELIRQFLRAILMNVYTQSKVVRVNIAPSGTAYTAGDTVGTAGGTVNDAGKIPLANALREPSRSGILNSLIIYDEDGTKPALDIYIFDRKPSGDYPDNDAWPGLEDGDDGETKLLGIIQIAAADWVQYSSGAATAQKSNLGMAVASYGGSDLYATIRTSTTPDFTACILVANFGFLQD